MTAVQFLSSPQKFSSLPALTVTNVPSIISSRATTLNATGRDLFDRQCDGRAEHKTAGLPVCTSSPWYSCRASCSQSVPGTAVVAGDGSPELAGTGPDIAGEDFCSSPDFILLMWLFLMLLIDKVERWWKSKSWADGRCIEEGRLHFGCKKNHTPLQFLKTACQSLCRKLISSELWWQFLVMGICTDLKPVSVFGTNSLTKKEITVKLFVSKNVARRNRWQMSLYFVFAYELTSKKKISSPCLVGRSVHSH